MANQNSNLSALIGSSCLCSRTYAQDKALPYPRILLLEFQRKCTRLSPTISKTPHDCVPRLMHKTQPHHTQVSSCLCSRDNTQDSATPYPRLLMLMFQGWCIRHAPLGVISVLPAWSELDPCSRSVTCCSLSCHNFPN